MLYFEELFIYTVVEHQDYRVVWAPQTGTISHGIKFVFAIMSTKPRQVCVEIAYFGTEQSKYVKIDSRGCDSRLTLGAVWAMELVSSLAGVTRAISRGAFPEF